MRAREIIVLAILRNRFAEDGPGGVSWFGGPSWFGASDPDYRADRDALRVLTRKGLATIVSADRKWITARLTRKGIALTTEHTTMESVS